LIQQEEHKQFMAWCQGYGCWGHGGSGSTSTAVV